MHLFSAIRPIYFFWKCTGLITFSYNRNSEIVILKRDKLVASLLLVIMSLMVVINLYLAFQLTMVTYLHAVYVIYVCSITLGPLLNLTTFQYYHCLVIFLIRSLENLDKSLIKLNLSGANCNTTNLQKSILQIFLIYIAVCIATSSLELYFFLKFSFAVGRLFNFVFYYLYYIFNMSASLFIFFFLMELTRRFRLISKWFCRRIVDKDQGLCEGDAYTFFQAHRCLRDVSRNTERLFQSVILGKVLSTSTITLFTVCYYITHWKEIITDGQYSMIISGIWIILHVLEIMGIVYHFSLVRYEVSCILLNLLHCQTKLRVIKYPPT